MAVTLNLNAAVRVSAAEDFGSGSYAAAMNNRGDISTVQGLPAHTDLTRLGLGWSVAIATGSAFQPVAAYPTTLANIVLYNGYSDKSLVIDSVWCVGITSIAAATSFTQVAQISNAGVAAPTNDTAQLITGKSGQTYSGSAKRAVANTAFAIANKWTAIGCESGHPSTAIGAGCWSDVAGRFIIKPGDCFCVNVVASTAGGTMIQGVDWYEVLLDVV